MAEAHVLISRDKYQQLLPNNPPPSQVFDIKPPPPGVPKSDPIVSEGKVITAGDNRRQSAYIYDNPAYQSESSESEDSDKEVSERIGGKEDNTNWTAQWRNL